MEEKKKGEKNKDFALTNEFNIFHKTLLFVLDLERENMSKDGHLKLARPFLQLKKGFMGSIHPCNFATMFVL